MLNKLVSDDFILHWNDHDHRWDSITYVGNIDEQ